MIDQLPQAQRNEALKQLRQFENTQLDSHKNGPSAGSRRDDLPTDTAEDSGEKPELVEIDRLKPGASLIVNILQPEMPGSALSATSDAVRERLIQNIRDRNPYQLDSLGQLDLPGVEKISLAGLNEEQASLRLRSDPSLIDIPIDVVLLPLSDVGIAALSPFGYSLFSEQGKHVANNRMHPVPSSYIAGPGDVLRVQLFGNRNTDFELAVQRDGSVAIPEIGPIVVGGLEFSALRETIRARIQERFPGTQVNVTLGELRSIQVFLAGDVKKPGSYTVGSLSTMTAVLSAGGGVAPHGSLRAIELRRSGALIATLDVYDILLFGNTEEDVRVQAGDVVFVPPVGNRVTVSGEVNREAIYEFRNPINLDEVIALAGGTTPAAFKGGIKIDRIDPAAGTRTISTPIEANKASRFRIEDGDTVRVPGKVAGSSLSILLTGNVHRPGFVGWHEGMRLTDLLPDSTVLKRGSDLDYVLIRREPVANTKPVVLSVSLASAWNMRGGVIDLELMPRDTVHVFDMKIGRSHIVGPLIDELRAWSSIDDPLPVVSIGGSVNTPGEFPREPGMRVSDLLRAGGGLAQSAYMSDAELTRYQIDENGARSTRIESINLLAILRGVSSADLTLESNDYLNVRETPNWKERAFATLEGEVTFPGRYPIRQGETLASVIARAGGLTDYAFLPGGIFTREELKAREKKQLASLALRIERDLSSLRLSNGELTAAVSTGQNLLGQIRSVTPTGRLVIDLSKAIEEGNDFGIEVADGDVLRIPRKPHEVTVIGEVQFATSHMYDPGRTRDFYVERSGGVTSNADKKRIYVVRASGEVISSNQSRFFSRGGGTEIHAGDTIVVPIDMDKIPPLRLWTSVTQIVYNLAIAATAVARF